MDKVIPIGTAVYAFRTHPFMVMDGKVIEYREKNGMYCCEFYDSVLKHSYREAVYYPHLSREEAENSYKMVTRVLSEYGNKKKKDLTPPK